MGFPAQSQGMPPTNMGMPPMPQGMPPSQGQPMQSGQFGNMGAYVSPMAQRPQGSPMQGQPTPDMLNNIRMKLQGMGLPAAQPQGQPMYQQRTPDSSTIFNAPQRSGGMYPGMGYPAQLSQPSMNQAQPSQGLQALQGIMQGTPQY
jgi:hypothetical protein